MKGGLYYYFIFTMYSNYSPDEMKLAREIAETLNDTDSLPYHLVLVRKYNEDFLRKKLAKAMAFPESQIRKSRAALYISLINQSGRYGDAGH